MRHFIIVILTGLLAGCASSTAHSPRQQAGKSYDSTIPRSPSGCIPVVVSFAGDERMDADELKHRAKQTLKEEGYSLDDSYECRILVELIGKRAGCTAFFQNEFGDKTYSVVFDRKGDVKGIGTRMVGVGLAEKP